MFKQANKPVNNNPKRGDVLARPDWPAFLRRVLSDQRDLCRSLEAMCERQSVLVRGGDTDGLMRVLSQRQALVDRLAELGDEVAPFRAQWETCMASVNASDRAEIERDRIPLSPAARAQVGRDPGLWSAVLGGGDDYELLFTAGGVVPDTLAGVPVHRIGRVVAGAGVRVLDEAGRSMPVAGEGYRHF